MDQTLVEAYMDELKQLSHDTDTATMETDDPDECALKLRKFVDDSLDKPLPVEELYPGFNEDF